MLELGPLYLNDLVAAAHALVHSEAPTGGRSEVPIMGEVWPKPLVRRSPEDSHRRLLIDGRRPPHRGRVVDTSARAAPVPTS